MALDGVSWVQGGLVDARTSDPSKSRIILTHTNAEVRDLNIAARDKLRDNGELGNGIPGTQ